MNATIKVSMFDSANSRYTSGIVHLWDWLLMTSAYTPLVKELRRETDPSKRRKIKELLPAITVSCVCSERRSDKIQSYTNLISIDIDGKDNPSISDMEDLKKRLSKLPYIMYCGLSAGGKGLFCIIPYTDYTKHNLFFNALKEDFYEMGIVIDSSCSDECRLRFYSHDENPYINRNASDYKLKKQVEVSKCIHGSKRKNKSKPPKPQVLHIPNIIDSFLRPSNLILTSGTPLTKKQKVERVLNEVIRNQVDITYYYDDRIAIGYIISNLFAEEGRVLFHKVSSFYPNYEYNETDNKYSVMLVGMYHYNSDRLFEIAAEYGFITSAKNNS